MLDDVTLDRLAAELNQAEKTANRSASSHSGIRRSPWTMRMPYSDAVLPEKSPQAVC